MGATTATERPRLFALLRASGRIEAELESRLGEIGLSIPKLAALHQLVSAGDSLPLGHLAERLLCVKSNVTQLVDRLEADGFVARASDPTDRRSRLAAITAEGRKAYAKGAEIQRSAERDLFGVLSDDEAAQLMAIVRKLDQRGC